MVTTLVAIRFVVTRFVDARFVVTDVVVIRLVVTEVVVTWFVVTEAVVTCFDAVWFVAATRAGPLVGTTRLVRAATGRGGTGTWAIKPGARINPRQSMISGSFLSAWAAKLSAISLGFNPRSLASFIAELHW